MAAGVASPRDVLAANRKAALKLAEGAGQAHTRQLLLDAERDLVQRLAAVKGGSQSFTAVQLRATLAQVRAVTRDLRGGIQGVVLGIGRRAADRAVGGVIDYLGRAEKQYAGAAAQPLALNEAAMLTQAVKGSDASILRRLGGGEGPEQPGILQRYGMNVVGHFEDVLQRGLLGRKSVDEMKAEITGKSLFLQGAPGHWAERIVRTELMGAYNKASWEAQREADDQLGDLLKVLSATFDDRTGADSYAVHGQIRRQDEAFETWQGLVQCPPARPNDREVVVPHRASWPIPAGLIPKSEAEVHARWKKEGRKGSPPKRPLMTTVSVGRYGGA